MRNTIEEDLEADFSVGVCHDCFLHDFC